MTLRTGAHRGPRISPLALAIALTLTAVPAFAQDQDADGAQTLQRVEVTGSRIKRSDIEGQSPILTINREELERTGLQSIGDVLQELTTAGSSLNTKFNSSGNFGFPPDGGGVGAGSTTVDLRHLGAKRVLVLVDGIRWVNESSASGVSAATDLNTIPLAIVERVEVLEDGASSIYGSDAIAGVVNIITRRDFNGVSVDAYYGRYDEGDGDMKNADISWGNTGDRHTFFISASHVEQESISSADRSISRFPVPGTGLSFGSSATLNGRFVLTDPNTGTDLNLGLDGPQPGGIAVYDPTIGGDVGDRSDSFHAFGTPDRFNFAPYNLLLTPTERNSIFAQGRYQVSDNISWYVKTLYNERSSTNQAAPEPIFLGAGAGTGNAYADNITISATNPYNPFGFDLISSGPGANLALIGRRPLEGGPRVFEQDVDTWYFATGLEGSFPIGDRSYFWDVNYVRSKNKADQTTYGSYNIRRIAQALGPVSACNADPNCVPLNIFGGLGTITDEMLGYIQPVLHDESENEIEIISANLTGDLFELPAGALAFAAGYEHRDQEGFYRPDSLVTAGESNGVPSSPTGGSFDVDEFYVEFNVPILSEVALAKRLDFSVAARYSDYSTFGGETTGKFGVRWQPVDDLTIRGTYAEGFRAPSIGELFGGLSRFDATLTDPCSIDGNGNPPPAATQQLCQQGFGVAPGFQQANPQISVFTGGSDALEPETADSITVGFVYSPGWAEGLSWSDRLDFEVNYYRHEIDGAIQAPDLQTRVDRCVASGDPDSAACFGIDRASTGDIIPFENRLQNLGEIKTDGYDVNISWTSPQWEWGGLRAAWRNTIVDDYTSRNEIGQLEPRGVGVEVNDSSIPEWTSTLSVDWRLGSWSAGYTARFIDDLTEDCGDAASFAVCSNPDALGETGRNHLPSVTYHDVYVTWDLPTSFKSSLTFGVNNLGDKTPPTCLSCSLNGFDAGTYDLPGRFYYVRAGIKFD